MPIFQSLPAKRTLICQNFFLWKSAIFHSIKLPFDAEVAEKFLKMVSIIDVQYSFSFKKNPTSNEECTLCSLRLKKMCTLLSTELMVLFDRGQIRCQSALSSVASWETQY